MIRANNFGGIPAGPEPSRELLPTEVVCRRELVDRHAARRTHDQGAGALGNQVVPLMRNAPDQQLVARANPMLPERLHGKRVSSLSTRSLGQRSYERYDAIHELDRFNTDNRRGQYRRATPRRSHAPTCRREADEAL